MMKRYVYLMVYLTAMLIVSSCVDRDDNCGVVTGADENGDVTRTFTLQLPSPVTNTSTYGMTEEDENGILTLDILAFKVSSGTETFAYHAQATKVEDVNNNYQKKVATVKLRVSDDQYRFVFLANVADEINSLGDLSTYGVKNEVLQRLIQTSAATKKWGENADDYFPMWGESTVLTISENSDINETVKMLRSVSRIDVVTDEQKVKNFEVTAAYLYQYNTNGHIVPDPGYVTNSKVHTPTIPTGVVVADKSPRYDAINKTISQQIYTYESKANTAHLEKTCLVVGGLYKTENNPNPSETWYRIDFVDLSKNDIHLLRNHCYTLNIIGVNGEGYTDPDEAYEARPFNIRVEVIDWDQGEIRDIIFNGQYFLGVSESEIYMPKPAADTSVIVVTDYPRGWTPTFDSSDNNGDEWLTYVSGEFDEPEKKEELVFHLTENNDGATRTGYIYLKAGVLRHTIKVHQSIEEEDGPPEGVKWLDKVGDANCYILSPSGDGIRIPVSQANRDGKKRIGENDELEVEVLWTDTEAAVGDPGCVLRYVGVEGKGNGGHLEVVASKTVWGNALVAVKVNDEIKWSWHIWVLEYTPDQTAIKYPANNPLITLMDRNLGALSASATPGDSKTIGLTYQWGRKDPFPGPDAFSSNASAFKIYDAKGKETHITYTGVITTQDNMLEESIKDPMEFIRGYTGGAKDWYTSNYNNMNDKLWENINSTTVSPYDPCPDGWTIDISRSFWDSNNSSFNFDFVNYSYGGYSEQIGFWPTGGYRSTDGSFNNSEAGRTGYYWMGQANGGDANTIKIQKDLGGAGKGMGIGYPNSRALGLSVRCKKME